MNNIFRKNLNWVRTYRPEFNGIENIVVFASGTSVNSIPRGRLDSILGNRGNLVITLNYGQKKIEGDYNFITDLEPIRWASMNLSERQKSRCVFHHTNIPKWGSYYFRTQDFQGRKSTFTLVNALMSVRMHEQLEGLPIWIYGLDMYVKPTEVKFYDDVVGAFDQNNSRKNPKKYFDLCERDLDVMLPDKRGIYNCNHASSCGLFEFKDLL